MVDRYRYINPSRVRTLVVPINGCTQADFARYLELVRSNANEVRLLDVTPIAQLQYFNPQTFPHGKVMFDYVSHAPEADSIFCMILSRFERRLLYLGLGSTMRSNVEGEADRGAWKLEEMASQLDSA